MADQNLSLPSRFIEGALRLYDKFADRSKMPANKRVFLESVLDSKRGDVTSDQLSGGELKSMYDLIRKRYEPLEAPLRKYKSYLESSLQKDADAIKAKNKDRMLYPEFKKQYLEDLKAINDFNSGVITRPFLDLAAGKTNYYRNEGLKSSGANYDGNYNAFDIKPYVRYEDYPKDVVSSSRKVLGDVTPIESIATLLGQFGFTADDQGNLSVIDNYDFNPSKSVITGALSNEKPSFDGMASVVDVGPSALYNQLRAYAGEKIPEGAGRRVNVTLSPLQIQQLRNQE